MAAAKRKTFLPTDGAWSVVVLVCGLLPMGLATLTMILWVITFANSLQRIGMLIFLGGLLCFAIGCIALLGHLVKSFAGRPMRGRSHIMAALGFVCLFGNLPLVSGCIWIAECYHVRVVNSTSATLNSVIIRDPNGRQIEIGPLSPGKTASKWFHPQGEGAIDVVAKWDGGNVSAQTGYVYDTQAGARKTVTITGNGAATVR